LRIADSIWIAAAMLHREQPEASDFSVQEIIQKASIAKLVEGYRPGLPVHASKHCVANKPPNPGRHRLLVETTRGRRRLFRTGDSFHPDRQDGKVRPDKEDLPSEYRPLIDWYDMVYSKQSATSPASVAIPHRFPPDANKPDDDFSGFSQIRAQTAFVGPGGTIVIPAYLQTELNLKVGSCVSFYREKDHIAVLPITDDFLGKIRGSLKGCNLLEDREREHRIEKQR